MLAFFHLKDKGLGANYRTALDSIDEPPKLFTLFNIVRAKYNALAKSTINKLKIRAVFRRKNLKSAALGLIKRYNSAVRPAPMRRTRPRRTYL